MAKKEYPIAQKFKQPKIDSDTYPNLKPIIDTVAAFARISHQWLYVADIIRRTYLYISEDPGATLGADAKRLTKEGYNLIIDRVAPNERSLYNEVLRACENMLDTLTLEQRKHATFKFDITSMEGERPRLLHHVITPLVTNNDGMPWIVMSLLSPSMYKEAGHLLCETGKTVQEYNFELHRWQKVNKTVKMTVTERDMLIYSARGYTLEEISRLTYRTLDTVKMHRRNIFKKLGVSNINEALYHAIMNNML